MARKRVSKSSARAIVAPGMRGAEDYVENVAQSVARSGVRAAAHGMASTREVKGVIDEMIAASYRGELYPENATEWCIRQYVASLWVYSAVRQIATNLAAVPLVAEVRTKTGWEADADSELQDAIDNPQTPMSTGEIIERASTFLETCGSEVIVAERQHGDPMNTDGPIVGLIPLRPSSTSIIAGGQWIEGYRYSIGGRPINIAAGNGQLARYVHPDNDYWGLSPLSALTTTVAIDASVETYNRTMMESGGAPDIVIETEQSLQRSNAKRAGKEFEARFMRARKAGRVPVLDAGMKVKSLGLPPKDMQYQDAAKMARQRILSAYGVPPIMVMDLSDASLLANADAQIRLFYKLTLKQRSRAIESALTRLYQSWVGAEWRVRFAFEQVDATRDPDKERDEARKTYLAGLTTRNEARAAMHLEPIEDGGDEFHVAQPQQPDSFSLDAPSKGFPHAHRRPQFTREYKEMARRGYASQFDLALSKLRVAMRKFFASQRDRVLSKFATIRDQVEPVSRGFVADSKALRPDDVMARIFDEREEREKFVAEVGPVFLLGMVEAGNAKIEALAPSSRVALNESHSGVRDFYAKWGATRVAGIQEKTRDSIKETVADGFERGLSGHEIEQQIVARFRDLAPGGLAAAEAVSDFPQYRLERIARTETQVMLNEGGFAGVEELTKYGADIRKSWLTARDELTRESHAAADEETDGNPIPLGKAFSNGLMHPGDSSGPASEVVNCRCSLIEVVVEEPSQ